MKDFLLFVGDVKVEVWGKLIEVGYVVLFIFDVVLMMVVCFEVVMVFVFGIFVLDSRVLRDCGIE